MEDEEFHDVMEIIRQAKDLDGAEKIAVDKTADKATRKQIKERNLAVERTAIIMADLNKFTTQAGLARLCRAEKDVENGVLYLYENSKEELAKAKAMPRSTSQEK